MNTAEILRAAAARVRQGWCRGDLDDLRGNVCALGALEAVLQSNWWTASIIADGVESALHLTSKTDMLRPLAVWNDDPTQTAENVAQGLEYAALLWEQEQAQNAVGDVQAATQPVGATD